MSKEVKAAEPTVQSVSFVKEVRVPGQSGRFSTVSAGMVKSLSVSESGVTAKNDVQAIFYPWSNVADVVYAKG